MSYMKKLLTGILCLSLFLTLLPAASLAKPVSGSFIALGGDLTDAEKEKVLDLLGVDEDVVEIIYTHIEDEKELLGDIVPPEKIGRRSLSSAAVILMDKGEGIKVSIKNINWVTPAMYTSALATAGVTDARVTVAAPFEVSGTAALAGILKAYEIAANVSLDEDAKKIAGEELVTTSDLGELIGKEDAERLVAAVKQYVAENGLTDPAKIRPYVVDTAKQMGISLTDDQIDTICKLMAKIATLDLDPEELKNQINDLYRKIEKFIKFGQDANDFFASVAQWFANLMNWFANLFKK